MHAQTSYDKTDIAWRARFRDMYLSATDHVVIDLALLDDSEPVTTPASI